MDKAQGFPLSQVWDEMKLSQKLQVLLAMTRLQKKWLNVSFSHYGSLYYARDFPPSSGTHYIKDGQTIPEPKFTIRPATGRDWVDASRSTFDIDKGPCTSKFLPSSYIR